jgi:hypothetical protein
MLFKMLDRKLVDVFMVAAAVINQYLRLSRPLPPTALSLLLARNQHGRPKEFSVIMERVAAGKMSPAAGKMSPAQGCVGLEAIIRDKPLLY